MGQRRNKGGKMYLKTKKKKLKWKRNIPKLTECGKSSFPYYSFQHVGQLTKLLPLF